MRKLLSILLISIVATFAWADDTVVVILKKDSPRRIVIYNNQVRPKREQPTIFPHHYLQFNVGDNFINSTFSGTYSLVLNYDYPDDYRYTPYAWFDSYSGTYTSYMARIPLTFSAEYYYAPKHWLHVGLQFYYSGDYWNISERGTAKLLSRNCNVQMSVLPAIRFQYLDRPIVGLYSGIAAGLYIGYLGGMHTGNVDLYPAFQLTALGLRLGNKVFWTAEVGVGHKGILTTGIGCRL